MKHRYRTMVLATIVLLGATAPVIGASSSAEFSTDIVETTAGETADIPISLSNTDSATVKIGSDQVNYIATVTVQDGNDDQTVTLQYDTRKAGHGGAFAVADTADSVTVKSETEFDADHQLDVGIYPLSVAPGAKTNVSNETDVATLTIMEQDNTVTDTTTDTPTSPYAGHVDDIDGGVVVATAQNQTITGTVNLSEGTNITVSARKGGVFLKTNSTTVDENGRFRASFDFENLPEMNSSDFSIAVRTNGEHVTEVDGEIKTQLTTKQALDDETTSSQSTTKQTLDDETTSSQSEGLPGFSGVAGIVALAVAVLLIVRRD